MRSKHAIPLITLCALSVFADRVHDVFEANRTQILANPLNVTVLDGTVYVVGRADSSRGGAVGYAKAEDAAKWALGNCHREKAVWAVDSSAEEREAAWQEYRATHPLRFRGSGLQRIWSTSPGPQRYLLVLAVPEDMVILPTPSKQELVSAVEAVRERWRKAEESARKAAVEGARKTRPETSVANPSVVVVEQMLVDEDVAPTAERKDSVVPAKADVEKEKSGVKHHQLVDEGLVL